MEKKWLGRQSRENNVGSVGLHETQNIFFGLTGTEKYNFRQISLEKRSKIHEKCPILVRFFACDSKIDPPTRSNWQTQLFDSSC